MPRCLRLHKVPHDAGFCAVCGTRVLPDWVWLCLSVLPLTLVYAAALGSRGTKPPVAQAPIVDPPVIVETRLVEVTRIIEILHIITATEPASPPTRSLPTVTRTHALTMTPSATPAPTATLYPRAALLSFHDLYLVAKSEGYGWVIRQEPRLDDKCGWYTLSPQADGKVALLTCHNRYVTAPRTGVGRGDWLLRQETNLDECGKFTVVYLETGEVALKTCAGRFLTAGNTSWQGLEWLVVAETNEIKDWEKFTLLAP